MNLPKSESKIQSNYPSLGEWDIEWQGKKFSGQNCMGIPGCCGSENQDFNNRIPCMKVRCQQIYDVEDNSRTTLIPPITGCTNCTDNIITKSYCKTNGFLKNNLDPINIIDCSTNFLNTGENNIIENVKMTVDCPDVTGNGGVSVDVKLPADDGSVQKSDPIGRILEVRNQNDIKNYYNDFPNISNFLILIIFLLVGFIIYKSFEK